MNNKPLVYAESVHDKVIEDEAGQIVLVNCEKITIRNQDISNATLAIELFQTHNCQLYNNTLYRNNHGLYLKHSDDNNIYDNKCYENYVGLGIFDFSDYNTIQDNKISNNDCGIAFIHSQHNTIKENIIEKNCFDDPSYEVGGVYFGLHARNNIIFDNIISENYNGIVDDLGYGNDISLIG